MVVYFAYDVTGKRQQPSISVKPQIREGTFSSAWKRNCYGQKHYPDALYLGMRMVQK